MIMDLYSFLLLILVNCLDLGKLVEWFPHCLYDFEFRAIFPLDWLPAMAQLVAGRRRDRFMLMSLAKVPRVLV